MTDSTHTKARIKNISTERIRRALATGQIVVVAGFQGRTRTSHHDAGARRVRHHGRGPGRRPEARPVGHAGGRPPRRVRNLHRRRRRVLDRPPPHPRGPQARRHQLRRDAGTRERRRGRDALAVDRVCEEVRRAGHGPEFVLRRRGDVDRARGRLDAGVRRLRRGHRQGRGAGVPGRRAGPAGHQSPCLRGDGRAEHRRRHDRPERRHRRPGGHRFHGAQGGTRARAR